MLPLVRSLHCTVLQIHSHLVTPHLTTNCLVTQLLFFNHLVLPPPPLPITITATLTIITITLTAGKDKVIKKEQLSDKTVGGKMRSDKVTVDLKDSTVKTPDKWQHDKFEEGEARDTPEKESDVTSFGKHWTKIRSE